MQRVFVGLALCAGSYFVQETLFGAAMTSSGAGGAIPTGQPRTAVAPNGARDSMVLYLAQSLGLGALTEQETSLLFLLATVYSFVLGTVTDLVLGEKGCGKALNGTIAFLGLFVVLFVYSRLFGQFDKQHISSLLLVSGFASVGALVLGALVKFWLLQGAEDYMAKPTAARPRGPAAPSGKQLAADRLNRIAGGGR